MIQLARILAGLAALFGIAFGLGFLFMPVRLGADFFLSPVGVPGIAVLRADMTAFFLTGGLMAGTAAWRKDAALLAAPILLFAIAIFGRAISLVVDGMTPGALVPMAVEGFFVATLCFARNIFRKGAAHG